MAHNSSGHFGYKDRILSTPFRHIIVYIIIFLSCFILSLIASSFMIQPQGTKAVPNLTLVPPPSLKLDIPSTDITMQIVPTSTGTLASAYHEIRTATDVPTGYSLSLAAANPSLMPIHGTFNAPTPLINNTWGYAVPGAGGFDPSYTTPTPSDTSKWADPTTPTTIKTTTNSTSGDIIPVYYGAKADTILNTGTYTNTIRYTLIANIADIPAPTITSITPNSGPTAGGTPITIVGTGFTVNDQSVTSDVTIDGIYCRNVSISSNTPTTGQDTIYCTTPPNTAGTKNLTISTWGGTVTKTDGYTYIAPANVTFVSPNLASTIAGTESGPAFTIVGTGFSGDSATAVTSVTIGGMACDSFTVVSDMHIFCKAPNTITTTGDKAIAVVKSNIASTGTVNVAYNDTNYPTLQASNAYANCSTTAQIFRDERDSQLYYVKKMPDNKCWMVDNLKYANYGNLSQEVGKLLTADGTNTESAANWDVAKYVDSGATNYCTGNTNMPANTNTRCGLLYNWYAATNGTGVYAQNTNGANVVGSICPANFRLPSEASDGNKPTSTGTSYDAADFPVLNASMHAGSLTTGAITNTFRAGWQPLGSWSGVFSGAWDNTGSYNQGNLGYFWSSTALFNSKARGMGFSSSSVYMGAGASGTPKYLGSAVRCVMDAPPTPPAGTNPPNISSTNPAVLDVYPTTGWAGDVITITSNALFTNVSSVTIGGTPCNGYNVVSASLIACRLPAKTAGTTNDIAITNNGANITNASTYTHMKITYFDPDSDTVNINGTYYSFYPNGFTSANCTAMTANNDPIDSTPATAIVYVRDTRNNQTYKVKKMVDNKCWMVDNLKYISTNMTYNNGDHLNNGGTNAYNTTDESLTYSDANLNKAFYNNPMNTNDCYSSIYMPANTLTHCGYLYNWYAATNGTGTYFQGTMGNQVTGNICPANFRLPSGMSDGNTPTSNGTSHNSADFTVLNASMNTGSLTTGNTANYPAGWQPSGAWGGAFSGYRLNTFFFQGSWGYFWSSTAYTAPGAIALGFRSSDAYPNTGSDNKFYGFAVRCVIQ